MASVIIPGGGASGATGTGEGGGDEVISLNTEHLTPSQQAVMATMEEAGVVSGLYLVKGRYLEW